MKKIFISGSSGFIGGHLVKRLKSEGFFVIGADLEQPKYERPHVFYQFDLRVHGLVDRIFQEHRPEEVYSLACLMGGMGYIGDRAHDYDIMVGSSQVVINTLDCAVRYRSKKIFYSSSACVYNQELQTSENAVSLLEEYAYPAMPDLVYGWQKLFGEQVHQAAMNKIQVRIARFHNIYGPEGTYHGGKEKAPAAICRKVASSEKEIEIWGTGNQTRSFLYIDDCIDAVRLLMNSEVNEPINIGSEEMISINDLAKMVIGISGKDIRIKNVPGPIGVNGRNSNNDLIRTVLGWEPKYSLIKGMGLTYQWIKEKVNEGNI